MADSIIEAAKAWLTDFSLVLDGRVTDEALYRAARPSHRLRRLCRAATAFAGSALHQIPGLTSP